MAQQLNTPATKPANLTSGHCPYTTTTEGENRVDAQNLPPDLHSPAMACNNNNK